MEPQATFSEQVLIMNAVKDDLIAPEPENTTGSSSAVHLQQDRSIFHSKLFVEEGDVVILHQTRENMLAVKVVRGEFHHSKYGRYAHDDMIGVRYGSKMASSPPHPGYLHLLRPTPALWSLSLPHRTQIVYLPDISFIMNELRVRTGSRVIEAGTGSGSMSHSLAMTIRKPWTEETAKSPAPAEPREGKLFTFEYHATRFEKAREEFEEHGLDDVVQLRHRNVCKEGFGDEPSEVDAVFLDLPAPWDAIPHAIKHLRADVSTRICCFSPCIEQVTRTVQALDAHGFTHIEMYEVLLRPYEMAQGQPPLRTVNSIANRLKKQEIFKEERRKVQMASARRRNQRLREEKDNGVNPDALTTIDGDAINGTVAGEKRTRDGEDSVSGQAVKKQKTGPNQAKVVQQQSQANVTPGEESDEEEADESAWRTQPIDWTTRVVAEVRGHTSYLTFATMFPAQVRADIATREDEKKRRMLVRTAELAGIPKEGANAVAMRAMAAAGAATDSVLDTAGAGSTAGQNATLPLPQRSMTREDSFDTQMDDGFDNAIAAMTDAELLALTPHKP